VPDGLDVEVGTPAEIGEVYTELSFAEVDPADLERDRRLLVGLRLLDEGVDLRAAVEALYGEQVLGLYVPEENRLYVGSEAAADPYRAVDVGDLSPYKRVTAAHELVHALQDGAYDIEGLRDLPVEQSDAALATLSLIEGEATLLQQQWVQRHQSPQEQAVAQREAASGSSAAYAAAPAYLQASLLFPYDAGVTFVEALLDSGGQAALDQAFRSPPTTTEQILHPDRYLAGETAREVAVAGEPGEGWSPPWRYSFGEFDLRELFAPLGSQRALAAADGWNGGVVTSWERGDETAVALVLAGDDPAETEQLCAAVADWYAAVADGAAVEPGLFDGDRDLLALRCTDSEVAVGLAPDAATARRLAGA